MKTSQNSAIANRLTEAGGGWVGMPELCRVSGSYNIHSRIADLRKRGHKIENKIERQQDGTNHSFYRLTSVN